MNIAGRATTPCVQCPFCRAQFNVRPGQTSTSAVAPLALVDIVCLHCRRLLWSFGDEVGLA